MTEKDLLPMRAVAEMKSLKVLNLVFSKSISEVYKLFSDQKDEGYETAEVIFLFGSIKY